MSSPSRPPVRSVTTATTIAVGSRSSTRPRSRRYSRRARWSGSSLTTYDVRLPSSPELDQPHDVAVQPEHAVDVGQVPLVEVDGERQRPDVGVVGGIGELQPH